MTMNSAQADRPPGRIVAGSDGSPASTRAVHRAARLAVQHGVPLDVLHVHDAASLGVTWRSLQGWFAAQGLDEEALLAPERDALQALVQELVAAWPGLMVRPLWLEGEAADAIAAHAQAESAGLVVVGAHGRQGLREMLLGSTADRLLRRVGCDLLLVRGDAGVPYRRLLLAVDLEAGAAAAAARALTLVPQAPATLLHVYQLPYEGLLGRAGVRAHEVDEVHARVRAELGQLLADLAQATGEPGRLRTQVEHGRPALKILEVAQATGADLLVLRANPRSELQKLMLGSVTLHLTHEAPCDLLLVRGAAQEARAPD